MNITNEYDGFINFTDNENENINIIIKYFLATCSSIFLLSLIALVIWSLIKPSLIEG